jgi:sulfate/thiosulfate transport system ATP-binding protein
MALQRRVGGAYPSLIMRIELHHVVKRFGDFVSLKDIDLSIEPGELVALLGPSGSGKTTLLRIIAGLEHADEGVILFDGVDAGNRNVGDRGVGFVFQHYALFRHMTVFENIAFGLRVKPRIKRPDKAEIRNRVNRLLALVQLEPLCHRFPAQLSGGQRQRVALARALAIEPQVLLLDEPFGALDAKVRKELRRWLRQLHDEMGLTSVFVTHDQEEALELADRVAILNHGRIEQTGTPGFVYERPQTPFVYGFLGSANRLRCRVEGGYVEVYGRQFAVDRIEHAAGDEIVAFVRPHDIEILPTGANEGIAATIGRVTASGALVSVDATLEHDGGGVEIVVSRHRYRELDLAPGQKVLLCVREAAFFPAADAAS